MKPAITKGRCEVCGIPMDAEYFDVSGFVGNLAIEDTARSLSKSLKEAIGEAIVKTIQETSRSRSPAKGTAPKPVQAAQEKAPEPPPRSESKPPSAVSSATSIARPLVQEPAWIDLFSGSGRKNEDDLSLPLCGEHRVLTSFQLNPQYCGILTYFAQYTDLYARDNSQILTPGFEWLILQNGKRVFPYTQLEMIVNPWGNNCLPVTIRLDEHAKVEFVLRNRSVKDGDIPAYPIRAFAGRLVGRYWYNEIYGGRTSA